MVKKQVAQTDEYRIVQFTAEEIAAFKRGPESSHWGGMDDAQWRDFMRSLESHPEAEFLEVIVYQEDDDWFIMDGYHRWKGTMELSLTHLLTIKEYTGSERGLQGMLRNANRRHLSSSQRAALVLKLKKEYGMTIEEAAAKVNVSARHVQRAERADRAGLIDNVIKDRITLEDAADIAKDKELLADVKEGRKTIQQAVTVVLKARQGKRMQRHLKQAEDIGIELPADAVDPESVPVDQFNQLMQTTDQLAHIETDYIRRKQELTDEIDTLEYRIQVADERLATAQSAG